MKAISYVILTACIALMMSGCSGQKTMEPMNSGMSGMEKPVNKMDSMENEVDTVARDSMAQPMKPQMKDMNNTTMP